MRLTDLERAALNNLVTSEYGEGRTPTVWKFCATGGIVTEAKAGGVVASLVKKGLVACHGRGSEATITVTEAGARALEES